MFKGKLQSFPVRMAQVLVGCDFVSNQLFQFANVREPARIFSGPDSVTIDYYLKYTPTTREK